MLLGADYSAFGIAAAASAILVVTLVLRFLSKARQWSHLPQPPSTSFLFGHALETTGAISNWKTLGNYPEPFLSWVKQYGGAIHLREFLEHAVLFTDPAALRHIFVSNGPNYPRQPIAMKYFRDKNLGESLSGVEGKQHDALRKWMNPLFTITSIKSFIGIFNSQTQLYCQNVFDPACDNKAPIDLSTVPAALEAYERSMIAVSPLVLIGMVTIPGFLSFPLPSLMKRRKYQATLRQIVKKIIQDKLAASSSEEPKDLLDMMFPHSTVDEAVAHTVTFIAGGYDTSSSALSFVFGTLASHPKVAEAIRSEYKNVISKHGSLSSWEAVAELTYTQAVIQETMRINAIAPGTIDRVAEADDHVPMSDGSTVFIPKGTMISTNIAAMHRNPKYWQDPESFIPNRFIEDSSEWNADLALRGGKPHAFHYMPFSFGNKNCIGQRFAMVEMQIIVATLVSKYDFIATSKTDMRQGFGGVTIRPANLEMAVRRVIPSCA
ncbi:unnamed protein product [Aphanomyces euteiches]